MHEVPEKKPTPRSYELTGAAYRLHFEAGQKFGPLAQAALLPGLADGSYVVDRSPYIDSIELKLSKLAEVYGIELHFI